MNGLIGWPRGISLDSIACSCKDTSSWSSSWSWSQVHVPVIFGPAATCVGGQHSWAPRRRARKRRTRSTRDRESRGNFWALQNPASDLGSRMKSQPSRPSPRAARTRTTLDSSGGRGNNSPMTLCRAASRWPSPNRYWAIERVAVRDGAFSFLLVKCCWMTVRDVMGFRLSWKLRFVTESLGYDVWIGVRESLRFFYVTLVDAWWCSDMVQFVIVPLRFWCWYDGSDILKKSKENVINLWALTFVFGKETPPFILSRDSVLFDQTGALNVTASGLGQCWCAFMIFPG